MRYQCIDKQAVIYTVVGSVECLAIDESLDECLLVCGERRLPTVSANDNVPGYSASVKHELVKLWSSTIARRYCLDEVDCYVRRQRSRLKTDRRKWIAETKCITGREAGALHITDYVSSARIRTALLRLVTLYEQWGKPEAADAYRKLNG